MVITLQQLIIIYSNDYCIINMLWIAYQPEELPSLSLELIGKTSNIVIIYDYYVLVARTNITT